MAHYIEVRMGEDRSVSYFDLNKVECKKEDMVILQTERGTEYGSVLTDPNLSCRIKAEQMDGKILRVGTPGDINQIENNRMKAKDAINVCLSKVNERQLQMKIVKAEYSFDSSKIIFFFTAEGRVDFRGLVKDLAKIFRVRIELKQIGVRDKAKIVSGYGVCGRELCCSSFLKGFHPLSIKMAKEQNLPLNPSRISGVCGRIKCCMAYEYNVYREYAKALPKVGDKFSTVEGKGRIVDVNVLKRIIQVDLGEGRIKKVVLEQTYVAQ